MQSLQNPIIKGLNAKFTSPGQSVSYTFYAKNVGEYVAYLNTVLFNSVAGENSSKVCKAGIDANGIKTTEEYVQTACNGINISVKVGADEAVTETTPVSNHALAVNDKEQVVVTISYESTAAVVDGPFTVTFGDISLVYSSVGSSAGGDFSQGDSNNSKVCQLTNDVNGNKTVDIGDEITCGGENGETFYVFPNDSSIHKTATEENISLLTKYNLDVGYIGYYSQTPIENPTGIQSPLALGYVDDKTAYGVISFSQKRYWGMVGQGKFVYSDQSDLYIPVENYKTYIQGLGVDVKEASLVTYNQYLEFESLKKQGLFLNFTYTSFWMGYAYDFSSICLLFSNGTYTSRDYAYKGNAGVRPIIVIPLSEVGLS